MGEGRGKGEKDDISVRYIPLPLIPSDSTAFDKLRLRARRWELVAGREGRGNMTFYETIRFNLLH